MLCQYCCRQACGLFFSFLIYCRRVSCIFAHELTRVCCWKCFVAWLTDNCILTYYACIKRNVRARTLSFLYQMSAGNAIIRELQFQIVVLKSIRTVWVAQFYSAWRKTITNKIIFKLLALQFSVISVVKNYVVVF